MTPKQEKQLIKLGPFSLSQAKEVGIEKHELLKLLKDEIIHRLDRGVYIHSKVKIPREIDFQVACKKFGESAVIGGLSALFYYNLVEQVPQQTWVLVSPQIHTKSKSYRLIRTKTPLDIGIIEGDGYQITSIERSIVEGFKLASKIGERTAIKAARMAISQKRTTINKIGAMAHELGLKSHFSKYFEAIIGAIS